MLTLRLPIFFFLFLLPICAPSFQINRTLTNGLRTSSILFTQYVIIYTNYGIYLTTFGENIYIIFNRSSDMYLQFTPWIEILLLQNRQGQHCTKSEQI